MREPGPRKPTLTAAARAGRSRRPAVSKLFQVHEIAVASIDVSKTPARRMLRDIAALAASMQDYGLQQPISVRGEGERFVLTSGLRRLSAAQRLGWATIPAFIRTVSADDAYVLDLVENLQRQDLTAEEEADALRELIRTRAWTLQQTADAIKRSVAYVSKRIRVFDDPVLRAAVVERGLSVSTAEELLAGPPEQRHGLIERAIAEQWDQGRAREIVRGPENIGLAMGPAEVGLDDAATAERLRPRRLSGQRGETLDSAEKRRGLTRAVREFHRLIVAVRAQDLTSSDRAALRSLFRDLVMLARAPAKAGAPIIPPLPVGRATAARAARFVRRRQAALATNGDRSAKTRAVRTEN